MNTKFSNLKNGEILSESQFYKVIKKTSNQVQLQNDSGENIVVDSKYVESCLTSADQISASQNVTMTEAANLLLNNPNVAMTVNFNKQVKAADVVKEVMGKVGSSSIKDIEKAIKAGIDKALTGEERTISGRHYGEMTNVGRIQFIDMNIAKTTGAHDVRLRQVDPRGINWIILKGIKYTVK